MIAHLGKFKVLEVARESPNGFYLDLNGEEILLPNKYCDGLEIGDKAEVFIYKDSEDRPVATKELPYLVLGEYAALEVVAEAPFGVFVDMGLAKHLLVPTTEMVPEMTIGNKYVVRLMADFKTERLIGVAKVESYSLIPDDIEADEALKGWIYAKTDLGYKIWTSKNFIGLIYHNQVFEKLKIGDMVNCFIDCIREDGKIDLRLKEGGLVSIDSDAQKFIDYIKKNGGESILNDKSSPEEIKQELGISKKAFKRALGVLYKQRIIMLEADRVKLV